MAVFKKIKIVLSTFFILTIPLISVAADDTGLRELPKTGISDNVAELNDLLRTGKPTLAYFYYSVACSCTAVQCSLAFTAIHDTPELCSKNEKFNFICIDAFYNDEVDSLYDVFLIPTIVAYDEHGEEVYRVEWDIDRAAVRKLVEMMLKNEEE